MSKIPDFFINYADVVKRIEDLNPIEYAKSRNFLNGAVSYLSPFITHGIISTQTVAEIVLSRYSVDQSQKLLAELGWREFFHRVWQSLGDDIFDDIRFDQSKISSGTISVAIADGTTGIDVIDTAIATLKSTGYMHNHARMWIASVAGNVAETHWYDPAKWLHYHLLDGDLASNTLSWQWIVGSFSNKKYYANQENLNKYASKKQRDTFLDVPYEAFDTLPIPAELIDRRKQDINNQYPQSTQAPIVTSDQKILLYSVWNLDPYWHKDEDVQRVLFIDTEIHDKFPMSPLRWKFIMHWAPNIPNLTMFVGKTDELFPEGTDDMDIITREYPATSHWPGLRDERVWLYTNTSGYFKNFFSYWKLAKKEIPGLKKLHKPHQNS